LDSAPFVLPAGGGEEGSVPPGLLAAAERTRRIREQTGRPGRNRKERPGPAPRSRGLRRLTLILGVIAAGLFLTILIGTLYTLVKNPQSFSGGSSRTAEAAGNGGETASVSQTAMFTDIRPMRIAAGSVAVVLSVVFPYPSADQPFIEELAGKVPRFRQIIRDYFGVFSRDELNSLDEQQAKAELLRQFNDELRLGSIELLLFDDYLILE
jgi:flagellar basal body-associated protein FliL